MTRRRSTALAAIVAVLALVLLQPVQETGCTQTSQLALTRALAAGTSRIDRWQATTCDKAWFNGHYYSVKAPALAAAALPSYFILSAADLLPASDTTTIWLLDLLTVVPAALVLALAVGRLAERVAPGSGVLAAAAISVGSMALPFGTLWFGHVPAAALAFSAFVLLVEGPAMTSRRLLYTGAGLIAGSAVLFEYPVALLAVALALYTLLRHGARALGAFLAGAAVPAALLFAYNAWAFGSATHFSYADAVTIAGNTGHDVVGANSAGLFGITQPSAHAFAQLMLSQRGLLTLTPLSLLGGIGIVLLYRRARAEALLSAGIIVAVLLYNSGLTSPFGGPFGGDSPGPRYLVVALPFLLFPLGAAARAMPGTAAALISVSAAAMVLVTATQPMVGGHETHTWLADLRHGKFTHTVFTLLGGGTGWPTILPFACLCAALAGVAVVRALRWAQGTLLTTFEATSTLVAWLLLLYGSSLLYGHGRREAGLAVLALATMTAGAAVATRLATASMRPRSEIAGDAEHVER